MSNLASKLDGIIFYVNRLLVLINKKLGLRDSCRFMSHLDSAQRL